MSEVKNIRISIRADEISSQLVEDGFFSTQIDCYRTAIAVALAKGLDHTASVKLELNKWDTAAVFRDPKSNTASLVDLFLGDDDQVSNGISLAEQGLEYLENQRLAGHDIWKVLLELSSLGLEGNS